MIEVYRNQVNLEVNGLRIKGENFIYNGTTYVPLRLVSETFGNKIDWDSSTSTVIINKPVEAIDPQSSGTKVNSDSSTNTVEADKPTEAIVSDSSGWNLININQKLDLYSPVHNVSNIPIALQQIDSLTLWKDVQLDVDFEINSNEIIDILGKLA
jgi:hypothetical protein